MSELPKSYDPSTVEPKWYAAWLDQGLFHAEATSDKPSFSIVIPPPNVTGSLHMGHAMYVIQDMLARVKRMQGFNVLWLPGTDHAGIATQLVVERQLMREEGLSRHDLSKKEFIQRIWHWKKTYGNRINEQLKVLGFSLDWERTKFTLDEDLSVAVTEAFVRLYEEGLIYRANRLINWCSRCFTALSDLEVESVETKGSLWHISYPIAGSNETLVVATTRPETLLGDTAIAVHPADPRFSHLIGKRANVPLTDRTIPIIGDDILVSMEFGTGAVKVTPGHDFRDFETGQRHNLETISLFTQQGTLNDAVPMAFQGLTIQEARNNVLQMLESQGLLVKEEPHTLQLGRCSRCDTIIEPILSKQWFVKTKPLAERAMQAVREGKTTFTPGAFQDEFFRWMENIRDWCISRQLVWGHQIPAWYDAEGNVFVARTEAEAHAQTNAPLTRDNDVLDTWFSSALWPFSTLGWPQETKELQSFYPTSVMETGHDILFFWVARMMMMGLHFTGDVPFKNVLLHALVVDETGDKMSKVKGNVIDPLHLVHGATLEEVVGVPNTKDKKAEYESALGKLKKAFPQAMSTYPQGFPRQGADALRFFCIVMAGQERTIRLSIPRIEGYRHFLNKIWSALRFFQMYADGYTDDELHMPVDRDDLNLTDRFILSRLQRTISDVDASLKEFQFSEAAQRMYKFFWEDVCDWYIEASKPYLQSTDASQEKQKKAALRTLLHILESSMRLLHPIIPFITEEVWSLLPGKKSSNSLMLASYPTLDSLLIDDKAEQLFDALKITVSSIRHLKLTYRLPNEGPRFLIKTDLPGLEKNRALLEFLARVQGLNFTNEWVARPGEKVIAERAGSQTIILEEASKWVDFGKEIERIAATQVKVEKELESLESRLSKPDFIARAKPEVVEKDTLRAQELRSQLQELVAQAEALK